MDLIEGMDADLDFYILSKDLPEEQNMLYQELDDYYGTSVPFVSDPELKLIDQLGMKNEDVAYRGYAMLDPEGEVVFQTKNDHWGEEIEQSIKEIENEYQKLIEE